MITLIGFRCTCSNALSQEVLIRRSSAGKQECHMIMLGVFFVIKIEFFVPVVCERGKYL